MAHVRQSVRYRERIVLRLSPALLERVRREAGRREQRVSEFLRAVLAEKIDRIEREEGGAAM